jgi:hypothetical protein
MDETLGFLLYGIIGLSYHEKLEPTFDSPVFVLSVKKAEEWKHYAFPVTGEDFKTAWDECLKTLKEKEVIHDTKV